MESLRIRSLNVSPKNSTKASPIKFGSRRASLMATEQKYVKNHLAVPPKMERTKIREKHGSCVPVGRSAVFPYYITSQSGTKKMNNINEEQGQMPKIGILKKQRAYRNLFVLLEPSYKQQSL
mmetsp:Transcript_7577/g.6709  ORF Transcript_7577/g.6709 Transcript_7577/m.6709 type:complete len:122 (-) Transcript_7577:82-447(-)